MGGLQIPRWLGSDPLIGLVLGSCHPGVLGSIPKREEPGKTGAPCVKVPGSSRVPVRDEQTHPHRPRLVVSHSTCPPLSSPRPREHLCNRSCSNKTHTPWSFGFDSWAKQEEPGKTVTRQYLETFRAGADPGTILSVLVAQLVGRLVGDGFWKRDYGWGVRVRRHFDARGMSSVRYGTRLGDLKINNQHTHFELRLIRASPTSGAHLPPLVTRRGGGGGVP